MGQFLLDLTTWYWWISVVVVGVAINLFSAYAKPCIDTWRSGRSETARLKRVAETAAFDQEVETLVSNPTLLIIAGQHLQSVSTSVLQATVCLGFLATMLGYVKHSDFPLAFQVALVVLFGLMLAAMSVIIISDVKTESMLRARVQRARASLKIKESFTPN